MIHADTIRAVLSAAGLCMGFVAVVAAHELLIDRVFGSPVATREIASAEDQRVAGVQSPTAASASIDQQVADTASTAETVADTAQSDANTAQVSVESADLSGTHVDHQTGDNTLAVATAQIVEESPVVQQTIAGTVSTHLENSEGPSSALVPVMASDSADGQIGQAMPVITGADAVTDSAGNGDATMEDEVRIPLQHGESKWSAVWRPFYSRTTATGFSDYIADLTGLKLRVSASRIPGQYLVEVEHQTEAERLAADKRIVEATGYRPIGAVK